MDCDRPMNGDDFATCVAITNQEDDEENRRLEARVADRRGATEKEAAIARAHGVGRDDAVADAVLREAVDSRPLPDPQDDQPRY